MRRATLGLFVILALSAGARSALASGLDVRLGGFFPRGGGTLWSDDCDLYRFRGCSEVEPDRFAYRSYGGALAGLFGGIEYNAGLAPFLELGVGIDGYGQTVRTSYRRHFRDDGGLIRQRIQVSMAPVGATLRVVPSNKHRRVAPYLGLGVDAVFYSYEERGSLIDFYDPSLPVVEDSLQSDGVAFGMHALGGVRIYLNRDLAIVGEGRYQWAKRDMHDDFAPNESGLVNRIDLSGASFVVGLHLRF